MSGIWVRTARAGGPAVRTARATGPAVRTARAGGPAVRTARMGLLLIVAATLTACTAPLPVDPAPYAADPECARVMLAAPETLGGLPVRATTSQATAAYGTEYPIVVRCGVEPPGPSTDACVVVTTGGTTLGWLVSEQGDNWLAVSFGHSPAVEASIPRIRADQAVGDILAELSPSAARAPLNGLECR